jgi:hypothetical protein
MENPSLSTYWRAAKKVGGHAQGTGVMARRLIYWIVLFGGAPLANWLAPKQIIDLPPYALALWMASIAVAFLLSVQAVAAETRELDRIRDTARHRAYLPPEQRVRIQRLKEDASRLKSLLARARAADDARFYALVKSITDDSETLPDHSSFALSCKLFTMSAELLFSAYRGFALNSPQVTDSLERAGRSFDVLLASANEILIEHPENPLV